MTILVMAPLVTTTFTVYGVAPTVGPGIDYLEGTSAFLIGREGNDVLKVRGYDNAARRLLGRRCIGKLTARWDQAAT